MRLSILGVTAALLVGLSACSRDSAVAGAAALTHSAEARTIERGAAGTSGGPNVATPARVALREITIPARTALPIVLDDTVGSDISRTEQVVHAHLRRPIIVRGETVLPQGSRLTGVVTDATRSAKVKGRAHVAVRFDTVLPRGDGEPYAIRTAAVGRLAPATKKKDALTIAGPAAGGALIGSLIGGKKGAIVGTAVGAGGGTAVVLSTRGREIHLPKGTALTLRLSQPLTVRVGG